MPKPKLSTKQEVTIDRRRSQDRRGASSTPSGSAGDTPVQGTRRKVQRRRQIDPTTCEREYKQPEIEFMQAIDAYKRSSGRMFPTCSEILEVIQSLGYVQLSIEERELLKGIQAVEVDLQSCVDSESAVC